MHIVVTLWWLLFFTAFGLSVGSFLNVVIFRLPRGLQLSKPTWSFCPHCETRLAWFDNLPVLSYLRLGGQCRYCSLPISVRYPVVELLTAIIVVVLLDAFFIAQWRQGLSNGIDLNERIYLDWPLFLAHVILFTCLLAMSAIDLQHYWIDIRFTHFATIAGFVLFSIWTPQASQNWIRPYDTTAVICLAVFVTFVITLYFMNRAYPVEDEIDPQIAESENNDESPPDESRAIIWPPLLVLLFVIVSALLADGDRTGPVSRIWRAAIPLALLLIAILREAATVRESDTEIIEAIEEEAPDARRQTLFELSILTPAIIVGVAMFLLLRTESTGSAITAILHWNPAGEWQPLWGLGTAASGYIIAAAIGWTVRILSNLAFGKEAFATGDIHMMAAAGAVIGWPTVLLGFVVTCVIASLGWVLLLPFKKTRAIPLGPWLLLGFLTATILYQPLIETPVIQNLLFIVDHLVLQNPQESPVMP